LFKDQFEMFRGSFFIRYKQRKQALKCIQMLSMRGVADNRFSAQLVDKAVPNQKVDVRFADKRKVPQNNNINSSSSNP